MRNASQKAEHNGFYGYRFYFIICVRQELSADYVEHECRETAVLNDWKSSLLCLIHLYIS